MTIPQSGSDAPPAQDVRSIVRADAASVSATLARAFFDDPLMMFLLPDEDARRTKLPRLFALLLKLALPFGACDVTEGYEAATLWRPPGHWHMPFWQYLVHGGTLLGVFGAGTLKVMNTMDLVEKQHPKAPHWYLQVVGTDPAAQGKGFGGRVLRRQLARIDAAGMAAYLESSKDTNIPIYQRLGFELRGEIKVPGGPVLYPMWRDPKA